MRWEVARLAMMRPGGEGPDDESWGDLTAEPREVDYLETEAGGRPAMWAVPNRASTDRVLLCLHGGGFVSGSIYTHRKMFGHLAKKAGARALLVGDRLLPEGGGYPEPAVDVVAAYRWLLDQGIEAAHVAFVGDSTGGRLAIAAQLRARGQGLPLPAAALLLSPVVDLEVTGASYETNRDKDPFFQKELVRGLAGGFLGEAGDPRDPLANPLYADLSGLGPVYLQAGGDETLLDDARRLEEHARKAGVEARLDVFPGMLQTSLGSSSRAPSRCGVSCWRTATGCSVRPTRLRTSCRGPTCGPGGRTPPSRAGHPATIVATRESLRFALIASLQYLPGRQRAVLLLREVLGFPAAEVAAMLGTSTGRSRAPCSGPAPGSRTRLRSQSRWSSPPNHGRPPAARPACVTSRT
jgi:acetyl esterase/lipase